MRRHGISAMRPDRGSASTELALVTPMLILILLVAVDLGKLAGARLDADEAAHQAARAASLARSAGEGRSQAQAAAASSLDGAGSSCLHPNVATVTGGFQPGQVVTVNVTCHVSLMAPGLPGQQAVSSRAASVVDLYRGVRE